MRIKYLGPAHNRIIPAQEQIEKMDAAPGVSTVVFHEGNDFTSEIDPNAGSWLIVNERDLWEQVEETEDESKDSAEVPGTESVDPTNDESPDEGQLFPEANDESAKGGKSRKGKETADS